MESFDRLVTVSFFLFWGAVALCCSYIVYLGYNSKTVNTTEPAVVDEAVVLERQYVPGREAFGKEMLHPERYVTIFRCKHGFLTVDGSGEWEREVWSRFQPGQAVSVVHEKRVTQKYWKGVVASTEKEFVFQNAWAR